MLKSFIQNCLRPFGFQLYRLPTPAEQHRIEAERQRLIEAQEKAAAAQRNKLLWLKNRQIKTIFDIGANTGQFAEFIRQIFPEAMLYSFEPLQNCYQELTQRFEQDAFFQGFNLALSDEVGDAEIHRNAFSPSSSLLPMRRLHKEVFPHTQDEVVETIRTEKLDNVANQLVIQKPILIKLDVQGFEDRVIAGGLHLIQDADVIITELSIEPLYEQQPLFDDIYQKLVGLGFQYRGNYEQLHNPNDGRVLQVDGIFVKTV